MIGKNWQLLTNEPVELEKEPVEVVQDCRKITNPFRRIYGIYPNLIVENRRISKCNRLDLQTLASQPIVPKIPPEPYLQMKWTGWVQEITSSNSRLLENYWSIYTLMSLLLLYLETLWCRCAQFTFSPCCHISLHISQVLTLKWFTKESETHTCLHASRWHHCHYWCVDFELFYAKLIFYYHVSMVT